MEITLQPWRAFKPDGVVLFSDILTPLQVGGWCRVGGGEMLSFGVSSSLQVLAGVEGKGGAVAVSGVGCLP